MDKMLASMNDGGYLVCDQDGNLSPPEDFVPCRKQEDFRAVVDKEALKIDREDVEQPKYLRLCRKFGIEWEPMSDVGHQRFNPQGALMFDLIADYAQATAQSLGLPLFIVKGTNMFDLSQEPVWEHAELYGDRLYTIMDTEHNKAYVLRYAACHQQFSLIKDWQISHAQIPFGAYELADGYRYEQSGETMLCFRSRRMNLPDCHVFCSDLRQAEEWFLNLHNRIYQVVEEMGRDYEILANFSSINAYAEHKELLLQMLRSRNKPALLHFYPAGINYYWTLNVEYLMVDTMRREREIATVQIDVGNAERFGINYTDKSAQDRYPIILHTALTGSVERFMYLMLDSAIKMEESGKAGHLPLWLTPEQVRLLPVSDAYLHKAMEIADQLEKEHIRVGIDDRPETVGKKVRDSRMDWVGYDSVIGERESISSSLKFFDRESNGTREMFIQQLIDEIKNKVADKPFRKAYFPRAVSKRPVRAYD
ncbi:threonine--tRNA ligase [Candidatus Poribacteria bacterium]